MNKSEWKLKASIWIFTHFRTANLNISLNLVECTFYHFRRVNFKILKDWMTMVVLNWLILLAVPEKSSHNLLSLKGDFVWFPTLGDESKNISGEGTYTVLDLYSLKIWWELKPCVTNIPSYIPLVVFKTTLSDEIAFHANWLVTKVPWFLCFIRLWGYLAFQTWYVCRRGGANMWLNCQFSRKKCLCFYNNFVSV